MKFSRTNQINEKLDYITEPKGEEEQLRRLREVASSDSSFLHYMAMAAYSGWKITGVPEGVPETLKTETDIPTGIADTRLMQELRRVKNFMPDGSMQHLAPWKREAQWIQILEGLHWQEQDILTQIKDQKLLNTYPTLRALLPHFKIEVDVPEEEEPTKGKKKSSRGKTKTDE